MGATASTAAGPKNIAIIGAGASGLAVLKAVLDAPQFKSGQWKVTLYEARDDIGGIWNPIEPIHDPPLTPLYDAVFTNIPHPIMAYTSWKFPPETPLFPTHEQVHEYFRSYAKHFNLTPHIRFNSRVKLAERVDDRWKIALEGVDEQKDGEQFPADLLVVANGHYRKPRYPNVPGVQAWLDAGKAKHSAWYRRPSDLGRKLLIVGGGPSGTDISDDLRDHADTILHSATEPPKHRFPNIHARPRVVEFGDPETGTVRFSDGTVESGIDYTILATGYQFWLPFLPEDVLKVAEPPKAPPLPSDLHNTTYNLFPLARNVWPFQPHYPPHTLAFIGLARHVITWPVMEAEARAALAVFADPSILEGEPDRLRARAERFADHPHDIHVYKGYEQFVLRNELFYLAARAKEPVSGPGGIADGGVYLVQDWERELFEHMFALRRLWVEIVEKGEAEKLLKGVGENGIEDWLKLARKILREAGEGEVEKLDEVEAVPI
ncbi:hypothetical protein EV121DRAFT_296750 [Schizophyllum commune]